MSTGPLRMVASEGRFNKTGETCVNMHSINPGQLLAQIASLIQTAIGYGLLLLIGAAVAAKFGVSARVVPVVNETALAWLCGCWWLWKGGRV